MNSRVLRQIALAGLIAATTAGMSTKAFADSGPWIRWQQGYREAKVIRHANCAPGRVVFERENGAGPVLASFIGGLVIGSAIHAQPVVHERVIVTSSPCPRPYDYYDPYCDESFSSLEACAAHARYSDHPRVVRVIEVSSGEWVDTYRWRDGEWRDDQRCERHDHRGHRHHGGGHDDD